MTIWFHKKTSGGKRYCSKSVTIKFFPQHWRLLQWDTNGAVQGRDACYDLNIHFLGIFISYTNWDYNQH